MKRALEQPRTIEFRRSDGRVYALIVGPTLLHRHAMEIVRGSHAAGVRKKTEEFVTAEQLASRWRDLVGRRRRNRYEEIRHGRQETFREDHH